MLKIISPKDSSKNIIIFIHGFIGGENTWIKDDGNMPFIDALQKDENINENFDIGIFEYHTELVKFFPKSKGFISLIFNKKNKANLPINDISKLLSTQIRVKCKSYSNIILIGHSMGGLVAKKYVLNEINTSDSPKVKVYISLATPHSGSDWATLGKKIIGNVQVKDLAPLGENVSTLNNEWVQCESLPKRYYIQGLNDQVVPKESSISLDRDPQDIFYTDDDHFSIILPHEKDNTIIEAIQHELKEFLIEENSPKKNNKSVKELEINSSEEKIIHQDVIGKHLDYILNKSLKSFSGQPITFIEPILCEKNDVSYLNPNNEIEHIKAESLINLPRSIFIKAPPQFGLTCLANYLRVKAWNLHSSIWLYIEFSETKIHNIKNKIDEELNFFNGDIQEVKCIIIDSWTSKEKGAIKFIEKICNNYPLIPVIVMHTIEDSEFLGNQSNETISREFEVLHLIAQPRNGLRKIVSEYNDKYNIGNEDDVLNKIVLDMENLNLHRTPLNCLTLLKVCEKYFDVSPVNRTEMIKMILFLLFNMDEIPTYKSKPDLKDCEYVLGKFCEKMIKDNKYLFTRDYIINYLKEICRERVIDMEVEVVFDILFKNNIIIKRGINFSFRYSYWVFYFGAQRMQQNKDFADYIFNEKIYVSIPEILEFYTGIDRSRSDAINIIINDLKKLSNKIVEKTGLGLKMNPYKHAKWNTTDEVKKKMKKELQEKVLNSKLPDPVKDQFADSTYDISRPYNQTIKNIFDNYSLASLMQTIKAASRALRNSDYVDPKLKRELLSEIQRGWEIKLNILLAITPILASRGQTAYDGVLFILVGGEKMDLESRTNAFIHYLPYNIVKWYKDDLFSPKLGALLFEQINAEKDELKTHILVLMVINARPRKWVRCIQNYIGRISKNSYYLYSLIESLRTQHQYGFPSPSEYREIEHLIKMCYAKHEFGGKKPSLKNITKISDKVLPARSNAPKSI